ncbi:UNVERIFIED_ORG: type I restriction enzyme S subunit [Pseudomonas lini]
MRSDFAPYDRKDSPPVTRTFSELINQGVLEIGDGYRAKNDELGGHGLIFLRAGHVRDTHIDFEGVDHFKVTDKSKFKGKLAHLGDVVVTTKGNSTGRIAFVTQGMPEFVYSPHLSFWRSRNESVLCQGFLRAWSRGEEFNSQLQAMSRSTDMAPYLSLGDQKRLRITLPAVEQQRAVSKLLDRLEDRITLLRETNVTLEAIAQALFKSWFVNFDPVRAKAEGLDPEGMDAATRALFPNSFEESDLGFIPRGWRMLPLEAAYEINPPRKLKKGDVAPYLDMASVGTRGHVVSGVVDREMGSGTKFINDDTLLARITPCLENGKSAFVDFLSPDQTGWGSTEFVVLRPRAPLPPYHGYLLARHTTFREYAIQSMSGTSGRQRVQNDVLGRYPVVVPSEEVAEAFGGVVGSIQQKIAANQEQAKTLTQLRDILLPQLISGQLRLSDTEASIENILLEVG